MELSGCKDVTENLFHTLEVCTQSLLPLITIFTALTHDDDQTKAKLLDSQEDADDNADEDAEWSACSNQFAEGCGKQEHGRWSAFPFHIWIRLSSLLHGDRSLGGCCDADKLLNGPTVASPLGFVIQNQS